MAGAKTKKYLRNLWGEDPHVRAFEAERLSDLATVRPAWVELYRTDRKAFAVRARQAKDEGDVRGLICASELMAQEGPLKFGPQRRYARALLQAGRPQEAAKLMLDERFADSGDAWVWMDLARSLAGSGFWEMAAAAAARAAALDPASGQAVQLHAQLQEAAGLWAARAALDWSSTLRLLGLCQAWGCATRARAVLGEALERAPPTAADQEAVLPAAWELLETAPGDEADRIAAGLLRAWDAAPGSPPARELLDRCLVSADVAAGRLEQALDKLSDLTMGGATGPLLRSLARTVGLYVVSQTKPRFEAGGGRIFNVMPFFDELLMIRLRMEEMASWVDRFVIIESNVTFTGRPKPLNFQNAKEAFSPWSEKITHVVLDRIPPFIRSAWARDFYQRDIAVAALAGQCRLDDLVLLTDADEIIDRRAVDGFDGDLAGLSLRVSRFFLNHRRADPVSTAYISRGRLLERHGISYMRGALSQYDLQRVIPDAGWHFTSIGGAEQVFTKVQSFAHEEHAHHGLEHYRDHLGKLRQGLFKPGWGRCDVDNSFPAYIRDHQRELETLLL